MAEMILSWVTGVMGPYAVFLPVLWFALDAAANLWTDPDEYDGWVKYVLKVVHFLKNWTGPGIGRSVAKRVKPSPGNAATRKEMRKARAYIPDYGWN